MNVLIRSDRPTQQIEEVICSRDLADAGQECRDTIEQDWDERSTAIPKSQLDPPTSSPKGQLTLNRVFKQRIQIHPSGATVAAR